MRYLEFCKLCVTQVPLFSPLTNTQVTRIAQVMEEQAFDVGRNIITQVRPPCLLPRGFLAAMPRSNKQATSPMASPVVKGVDVDVDALAGRNR